MIKLNFNKSIEQFDATATTTANTANVFTFDKDTQTITGVTINSPDVEIPDTIDGVEVLNIGDSIFRGEDITSVIFPDSIKKIGVNAFGFCSELTSINLPLNILNIENSAFGGCNGLTTTTITIPLSLNMMNANPFWDCNLTEFIIPTGVSQYSVEGGVLFNKDKTIIVAYPNDRNATEYIIPNTVTRIIESVFDTCYKLEKITIQEGVTTINAYAFYNCDKLTIIHLPNSITTIDESAFEECSGLESINIPSNVSIISNQLFYRCSKLKNIDLSNSITLISGNAFEGCTSLNEINIPSSVKEIGVYSFSGCSSLSKIVFNNDIKDITIGKDAFNDIAKSNKVDVYNTVKWNDERKEKFYNLTNIDHSKINFINPKKPKQWVIITLLIILMLIIIILLVI